MSFLCFKVREYWHDNIENRGRTLAQLRSCARLHQLPCWASVVAPALSQAETAAWGCDWDGDAEGGVLLTGQAAGGGGAWESHVASGDRMEFFRQWLAARTETRIAVRLAHFFPPLMRALSHVLSVPAHVLLLFTFRDALPCFVAGVRSPKYWHMLFVHRRTFTLQGGLTLGRYQ